jgi:predicted PurR-regulated permease PerM
VSPETSDRAFIERATRVAIVVALVVGVAFGLLWLLKGALTPLVTAAVIAYLFDPLIDRFEARRIPRRVAILLLLVASVGVLLGVAFVLVPAIQSELVSASERLPGYLEQTLAALGPRIEQTFGIAMPHSAQELVASLREGDLAISAASVRELLGRLVRGVTGTVGALVWLLIIPVLAYYLLVEFDRIRFALLDLVPRAYQAKVVAEAKRVDTLVAGFIRGQLTVCLVLGTLYAVGFSLIGIDFAVVIGIVSGLLSIIPYVGSAVALGAAAAIAMLQFGLDVHVLMVVAWYLLVQGLEGLVLTPKIVGGSLGMHPATVIVALLIGGDLLGFLGLLVAVPLAAVAQVFVQEGIASYRRSSLYAGEGAPATDRTLR